MDNTEMSVRVIGGPTAVPEIGGLRLVTDPTFDEPRDYPLGAGHALSKTAGPAIRAAEVGPADAVLLSHDQHPDNLDLAGRDYLSQVPLVLSTASAARRLGGNCRELGLWQHTDLPRPGGGALRVTRTPARHGPGGTEHLMRGRLGRRCLDRGQRSRWVDRLHSAAGWQPGTCQPGMAPRAG